MAEPRRGEAAPLLWLSRDDVAAALPPLEEQFACIRDALVWVAEGRAEVPPKLGVHPPGARHAPATMVSPSTSSALTRIEPRIAV